jgi:hypothetical protein
MLRLYCCRLVGRRLWSKVICSDILLRFSTILTVMVGCMGDLITISLPQSTSFWDFMVQVMLSLGLTYYWKSRRVPVPPSPWCYMMWDSQWEFPNFGFLFVVLNFPRWTNLNAKFEELVNASTKNALKPKGIEYSGSHKKIKYDSSKSLLKLAYISYIIVQNNRVQYTFYSSLSK